MRSKEKWTGIISFANNSLCALVNLKCESDRQHSGFANISGHQHYIQEASSPSCTEGNSSNIGLKIPHRFSLPPRPEPPDKRDTKANMGLPTSTQVLLL